MRSVYITSTLDKKWEKLITISLCLICHIKLGICFALKAYLRVNSMSICKLKQHREWDIGLFRTVYYPDLRLISDIATVDVRGADIGALVLSLSIHSHHVVYTMVFAQS
jgi:hypothetical protein